MTLSLDGSHLLNRMRTTHIFLIRIQSRECCSTNHEQISVIVHVSRGWAGWISPTALDHSFTNKPDLLKGNPQNHSWSRLSKGTLTSRICTVKA